MYRYKSKKDILGKTPFDFIAKGQNQFLKEQLKQIQDELGVDTSKEDEVAEYREKLEKI